MDLKRTLLLIGMLVLLSGCGAVETFETVADDVVEPVMAQMGSIKLELPEDASLTVMGRQDGDKIYLCDGYALAVQTLQAGDLEQTIRVVSGFGPDQVTILKTQTQQIQRYDLVWSAAGEGGDQLCRGTILDDGSFHYTLTAMGDAQGAGELEQQWDLIFDSFRLDQ